MTPVYKNIEGDGFSGQGKDYGVDIDLWGVSLGADYTFAPGLRVGLMFSVGSGDADGTGAGHKVSNDFDFYTLGLYTGYACENFTVTGDLTYTKADNDIDADTSVAHVSGSTDSEALSLGLTAQYRFETQFADIAPHIGLRYTRLDVDDFQRRHQRQQRKLQGKLQL